MNIETGMEELQTNKFFVSDEPQLLPCVFCGGRASLIVRHPIYGKSGAWAQCNSCGACGPVASIYAVTRTHDKFSTPLLPESLTRGITAAADAWNSRTVDRSRMVNMGISAETAAQRAAADR